MDNYNQIRNFKTTGEKYCDWSDESCGYKQIGFTMQPGNCSKDFSQSILRPDVMPTLRIKIIDVTYTLSTKLVEIVNTIEQSKFLPDLEEDWNGDNAEKVAKETWGRAAVFLIKYAQHILENFGIAIKSPEINPCRNGSIDLAWRTKNARLLINVKPTNSPVLASYYGDLYNNKQAIKNPIEDDTIVEHLAFWMKNLA